MSYFRISNHRRLSPMHGDDATHFLLWHLYYSYSFTHTLCSLNFNNFRPCLWLFVVSLLRVFGFGLLQSKRKHRVSCCEGNSAEGTLTCKNKLLTEESVGYLILKKLYICKKAGQNEFKIYTYIKIEYFDV